MGKAQRNADLLMDLQLLADAMTCEGKTVGDQGPPGAPCLSYGRNSRWMQAENVTAMKGKLDLKA
jgi:hypothetical protein